MGELRGPAAGSLYTGIRATITAASNGQRAWLSLSTKPRGAHWSEWDMVVPSIRVDISSATSTREALLVLAAEIEKAAQDI